MDTAIRTYHILRGQVGAAAIFVMRGGSAVLAYVMLALIARHSSVAGYAHFAFIFTLAGFLGPLSALGQSPLPLSTFQRSKTSFVGWR